MNLLGLAWIIALFSPGDSIYPLPTFKSSVLLANHASPGWLNLSFRSKSLTQVQSFSNKLIHWSHQSPFSPDTIKVVQQDPPPQNQRQKVATRPADLVAFWQCTEKFKPEQPQSPIPNRRVYQIWVGDHLVAALPKRSQANHLANRLKSLFQNPAFNPEDLRVGLVGNLPAGLVGQETLFQINRPLEKTFRRSGDLIAIDWVNNLRVATGIAPLPLVEAQSAMYGLTKTRRTLTGVASWYGPRFHNRLTATGERFNQNALTAAHPSLPFNTFLKVTNLHTKASVIVRINDRGPYVGRRSLDLSRQAARCVGSEERGVVPYEAVIMKPIEITTASSNPGKATEESASFNIAQQPYSRSHGY